MICSCRNAVHRQGGGPGGSSAQALARQAEADAEADQARKRFGNAKSISSAQFNADEESKTMDYEKQVGILSLETEAAKLVYQQRLCPMDHQIMPDSWPPHACNAACAGALEPLPGGERHLQCRLLRQW